MYILFDKNIYLDYYIIELWGANMKKDKKFLDTLNNNLKGLSNKKKKEIIDKYQEIILKEKESGKKITVILKELGNPEDIALKEIEKEKANSFNLLKNSDFSKFKEFLIKDRKIEFKKKDKKEKKKDKKNKNKDNKIKENVVETVNELSSDVKKEVTKVKKNFKFNKLFKKKNKIDKIKDNIEEIKEEITEISDDVSSDFREEIPNVVNAVSDKKIFESKKSRRKRIFINVISFFILAFVLFIFLWINIIFLAGLFALLDGVRLIGLNIALLGLNILIFWLFIMLNKLIFKKKNNYKLNLIIIISSTVVIALGVALTFYKIYHTQEVQDVSDKYSMTSVYDKLDLPKDESKKFYITFNANYKNDYVIEYDENLKDQIKLEVKYYENYYDYYIKKSNNNVYISLKIDDRDRISSYISDFKEGKIYSTDELSRYTIKITINENDKDRLEIIH